MKTTSTLFTSGAVISYPVKNLTIDAFQRFKGMGIVCGDKTRAGMHKIISERLGDFPLLQ